MERELENFLEVLRELLVFVGDFTSSEVKHPPSVSCISHAG